jgi:predicted ArsR family transcriptional regulator
MPKLTDTQAGLLAAAAARSDLSVLPPPETLGLKGATLERTLKALQGRGLIAAAPVEGRSKRSKWADPAAEMGERERLIVTPAGRAAIAAEPGGEPAPALSPDGASPTRPTKNATLITLLSTESGADIASLSTALGWLPHTTRAALTRLRQAGYGLEAVAPAEGGSKRYRIVTAPKPAAKT